LSAQKVYRDLFDLTDEAEMGHIELSRAADLIVVAPATADLMAKMANGLANDLASTLLLATDKRVLIAPSMNVRMWQHPATQRNLATLLADGVLVTGPDEGDMACGEYGPGRMSEPLAIVDAVAAAGAQGTALARALSALGAEVVFVTGPADVTPPEGVKVVPVQTAHEMLEAVQDTLPVDVAVFAAAVADWRVASASDEKIKKTKGGLPNLDFAENPDILATVAQMKKGRPGLVVGFAAETQNVVENATAKRVRKGCDWIIANDVSPETGIMGGDENAVTVISAAGAESWPRMSKAQVAARIAAQIADALT